MASGHIKIRLFPLIIAEEEKRKKKRKVKKRNKNEIKMRSSSL